jgi:predicted amidohydrolase YtcJ
MRATNSTAIIAACIIWLVSCGRQAPISADIILTNGRIFTGGGAGFVQAVAVRGESILSAGTTEEVNTRATQATRRIDLGGRLVIPGINDAHAHVDHPALPDGRELKLDSMDPSCAQVVATLKAEIGKTPESTSILAAIGPSAFFDTQCTGETLDRIAPRHAVVLRNWTGHAAILNRAAVERFRMPVSHPPEGGFYGKTMRAKAWDGVVQEYAMFQLDLLMSSAATDEFVKGRLSTLLADAARYGITSLQAMSHDPERLMRLLKQLNTPIRIRVISFPMQGMSEARPEPDRQVTGNLRFSGLKFILDGTPIERSMAIRKPYQDDPSWNGQLDFSEEFIRRAVRSAAETNRPVLFHVAGDRTAEVVLKAMESVGAPADWPGRRLRFEHGDALTADLIPRAKALGVVVVQNPSHLMVGDLTVRRLGPERAGQVLLLRSLIQGGVRLALGSDVIGPDGVFNPFLNILFAATYPNNPKEALTREQAIAAYTRGSAYAEFAENEKGTLEPGKKADLAVLSQNIFDVAPPELPKTESVLTMIGGKIVRQTF